jgi:hypothetical protein
MAYDTEIRSVSDRQGAPGSIQVNPSANESRAHEHDEHGAHPEPYHRHHQIYPRRYHFSQTTTKIN